MPDTRLIRTFLDPRHTALCRAGRRDSRWARSRRAPSRRTTRPPGSEARALLGLLGAGGWLQPILDLDLRACCLMREALGEASPLADAVFALQGLGTTPILLGGTPAQKERWLGPIARGRGDDRLRDDRARGRVGRGRHRHHRAARGIGLRAGWCQDADLQRRHRRPVRRLRLHRPRPGARKGSAAFSYRRTRPASGSRARRC